MLYSGYIKQNVRKVIAEKDIPLDRAINFLLENKFGVILDSQYRVCTLEELEDVKSISTRAGSGEDSGFKFGDEIPEGANTEVSWFTRDNTE